MHQLRAAKSNSQPICLKKKYFRAAKLKDSVCSRTKSIYAGIIIDVYPKLA
jgi:hypothetical protein